MITMTKNQRLGERCVCRHKYDLHKMQDYYPYRLLGCLSKGCDCGQFESEGIKIHG